MQSVEKMLDAKKEAWWLTEFGCPKKQKYPANLSKDEEETYTKKSKGDVSCQEKDRLMMMMMTYGFSFW